MCTATSCAAPWGAVASHCTTSTRLTFPIAVSAAFAPSPALYFMLDVGDTAGLVLTLCLLVLNGAILTAFAAVLVREYLAGAMAGWDADGDGVLTAQDVAAVGSEYCMRARTVVNGRTVETLCPSGVVRTCAKVVVRNMLTALPRLSTTCNTLHSMAFAVRDNT